MFQDPTPYHDGICQQVSAQLRRRGLKVRSAEATVKASEKDGVSRWTVIYPEITVEVQYMKKCKEWEIIGLSTYVAREIKQVNVDKVRSDIERLKAELAALG